MCVFVCVMMMMVYVRMYVRMFQSVSQYSRVAVGSVHEKTLHKGTKIWLTT